MLQLLLKYLIAVKLDDFPKIHSLGLLFRKTGELYGPEVIRFYENNAAIITALEEAYIGARYIDVTFDRPVAEEAIRFAKEFINLLEQIKRNGS